VSRKLIAEKTKKLPSMSNHRERINGWHRRAHALRETFTGLFAAETKDYLE
jgi:hypothetical protein